MTPDDAKRMIAHCPKCIDCPDDGHHWLIECVDPTNAEAIADFAAFLVGIDACQNPDFASQLISVAAFRLAGRLQCPK